MLSLDEKNHHSYKKKRVPNQTIKTFSVQWVYPVYRNLKTYFPDIPSTTVENPASRKRPAGPLYKKILLDWPKP